MTLLNVLLVEQSSDNNDLEEILIQKDIQYISIALESVDVKQISETIKPNVILFNLAQPTEAILQTISEINKIYAVPIILFSDEADTNDINKVIKVGVSAYIVNGIEGKRIKTIIDIAIARFNENKQLKDALEKAKSKLEERKLIERAKGILIKTRGFSEDESYHTLRKLAMDRNVAIADMAKNVIAMAELLSNQ